MLSRWFITSLVLVTLLTGGLLASAQDNPFGDGRLNFDATAAPVVVFCRYDGGLEVFAATGGVVFEVSRVQVQGALAQALVDGTSVQVAAGREGARLIAYPDNGLSLTADGGYQFTIPSNACSGFVPDFNAVLGILTDGESLAALGIATTSDATATPSAATSSGQTHTVQRGENLFRIGLRYGVHYTELARYNNIADPSRLAVGQVIRIP